MIANRRLALMLSLCVLPYVLMPTLWACNASPNDAQDQVGAGERSGDDRGELDDRDPVGEPAGVDRSKLDSAFSKTVERIVAALEEANRIDVLALATKEYASDLTTNRVVFDDRLEALFIALTIKGVTLESDSGFAIAVPGSDLTYAYIRGRLDGSPNEQGWQRHLDEYEAQREDILRSQGIALEEIREGWKLLLRMVDPFFKDLVEDYLDHSVGFVLVRDGDSILIDAIWPHHRDAVQIGEAIELRAEVEEEFLLLHREARNRRETLHCAVSEDPPSNSEDFGRQFTEPHKQALRDLRSSLREILTDSEFRRYQEVSTWFESISEDE